MVEGAERMAEIHIGEAEEKIYIKGKEAEDLLGGHFCG